MRRAGTAGATTEARTSSGRCVVLPGDPDWDLARRAWNLAVDQRPSAVARLESADHIGAMVELAPRRDLRIAPQASGHGALSLCSLDDTILLNAARMRSVRIDPGARRASVDAGVRWGEVAIAAVEHGLAGLAGSSPTVGVVGYSLRGGLGWLARRYGLAGQQHPCRRRDHRRRQARSGQFDEVTSVARLPQMPSRPDIPERLRGRSFVIVEAACIGTHADGIELLRDA